MSIDIFGQFSDSNMVTVWMWLAGSLRDSDTYCSTPFIVRSVEGKQWGIIFLLFSIFGRTPLICFEDVDWVLVTSEVEGEEGCSRELSLLVRVFKWSPITAIFVSMTPYSQCTMSLGAKMYHVRTAGTWWCCGSPCWDWMDNAFPCHLNALWRRIH